MKGDITISLNEYRPCIIHYSKYFYKKEKISTKKALFHRWEENVTKILLSKDKTKPENVLKKIFGIVEFEDGHIERVEAEQIEFIDNKFQEYNFDYKDDINRHIPRID